MYSPLVTRQRGTNMVTSAVEKVAPLLGIAFGSIAAAAPDGASDTVTYIIRGALGLGLLAVGYLLKDVAENSKETAKLVREHDVALKLHGLMFDQWLERLGESDLADNPGRRDTDKLLRALLQQRKTETGK